MVSLKVIAHVETKRREKGVVYSEWGRGSKRALVSMAIEKYSTFNQIRNKQ